MSISIKVVRAIRTSSFALSLFVFPGIHAQSDLPVAPARAARPLSSASPQSSTPYANPPAGAQSSSTPTAPGVPTQDPAENQRAQFEQRGLRVNVQYVADALAAPTGVAPTPENWWGRIRVTIDADLGKFTPDKGLGAHITSLWQYGTNIGGTDYVNSYANPSSLASQHVFRAAEYSLSQYLFNDHLEFRGGKIATWNGYGVQEYGESFINEPMGYAFNTFINTYMTYDPGGTPAFEMRVLPDHHWYTKAVVFSQEKSPYIIDSTGFGFHFGPPAVAAEIGYLHDPPLPPASTGALGREDFLTPSDTGSWPGVFKFGGSYNPGMFRNSLTGRSSPGNYIVWGQASQVLYREPDQGADGRRGLGATATIDWSPDDVNQQNQQMDVGVRYIGAIRGAHFANDMIDVGWVRTSNGSAYRESLLLRGQGDEIAENLVELNYLAHLTSWFLFQPVAEFIVNPSANRRRPNVTVYGFRIMASF
ncbi:MAG TPA: carbohydrate porin [Terracidiphilus sp.]|nr:carbohydrate porin [Terracidiphilus sp.]